MKSSGMKKSAAAAITAVMALALAGCGGNNGNDANAVTVTNTVQESTNAPDNEDVQAADPSLKVVTSFYPLYFLAKEIGGEHAEVVNLVAAGVEPHDWTPKSRDLSEASSAQLLLYHGAGLEQWIETFQKGLSDDSGVAVQEMSVGIPLLDGDEEGEAHEEHAHEEEEHSHEEEGHSHAIDPHTWVSPKSAIILAENVKNSLVEADAAHKDDYEANFEALLGKLKKLDADYEAALSAVTQKNLVVSHQAFGYLARDYGLNQVSIMGLSPEAEPKAQDLLKIAKFVEENGVRYIFFEELVSDQLARTLANEADVETMVLNPLEGLTKEQEKAGETYLSLMERNLQNLIQALQ
ncbi:metal ABC transporter solute-binding protein, Zn/Mn family [Paenibacillus soyae]|uniref:Zinc ABC transporter substrate-binding protein n=1 Tax=Paenibacillus soyae TaxID=2969249 RepID=A0A9X2S948_9BACL|nr:zinc ABC transporter substrate-binding protein [Paenibacillus soyae]MCR2803138.1 zinc ABC transporter substrate-binding protein [Paenibacillus soyae]